VDSGIELVRRLFVRVGMLGLLVYASCGGRTTLGDLSEQVAGESGTGGSVGGSGGKGGKGGKGGVGGTSGGVGGTTGGVGGVSGRAGTAGTGGIDYCQPEPCRNGGVCYAINGGWACRCPAGTFGADCSGNVDDCNPNPCVNGDCTDRVDGFSCDCYEGFRGEYCELKDECTPNPCLNGGTCVDEGDGFECMCPEGFSGSRCERQREPCSPNPCQNGGVCIDQAGDFLCACPAGFSGKRCQIASGGCPSPNPCQNGGTCVESDEGDFSCACPTGFAGPFCECRDSDQPQGDGTCVLRSVCGLPVPEAFGSGDCSDNTAEFADWWCQLGGYAQAESYETLTSGVLEAYYYEGKNEEVLSGCSQVVGPVTYGFLADCTGVTTLACRGSIDNVLRTQLMICGNSSRDPSTFIPPGVSLTIVSGCTPNASTQALMVTRNDTFSVDSSVLRQYLHDGGILVTEYNASDELWSMVFPGVTQSVMQRGSCQDNVPTVVQYSPMDPFWRDNAFTPIQPFETGCGYSVAHFPYLVPLAGWDQQSVGLGYRNLGQGRVWAADFDWQDLDGHNPALPTMLGYMITHRR
jgi:hypothetical protein